MLERAKETTRYGKYTYIEYARFADGLVILIDAHPRHDWLRGAVERRLREELAELLVEINEEKSRIVDLGARASASSDSISAVSAVVEVSGGPTARRSSRSGLRCCGSSKTCFVATSRNQWAGSCS
jgi:hypothetical protein